MPAKKAARPSPRKKAATSKAPAKKATARNAPAKKAPAAKEPATRKPAPKKAAARKAAPAKKAAKKAAAPRKLAFGKPGTAGKAEGDDAVRAWMEAVKPEHRGIVERLDALIGETVPDVKRAIKWSMPMYGRAGIGWFATVASFKEHVRLSFFSGVDLDPQPPLGESEGMRAVKLRSDADYDEKRFRAWIEQAASIPGWGKL